jgi:hypothetical protein
LVAIAFVWVPVYDFHFQFQFLLLWISGSNITHLGGVVKC